MAFSRLYLVLEVEELTRNRRVYCDVLQSRPCSLPSQEPIAHCIPTLLSRPKLRRLRAKLALREASLVAKANLKLTDSRVGNMGAAL